MSDKFPDTPLGELAKDIEHACMQMVDPRAPYSMTLSRDKWMAIYEAMKAYAASETKEWISVKDRLPEPMTPVLGYRSSQGWCFAERRRTKKLLWMEVRFATWLIDVIDEARRRAPASATKATVGGEWMEQTIQTHMHRAEHFIAIEQAKITPDNALIAVLCDSVRLCREYVKAMASNTAPEGERKVEKPCR
jgi:hypothetical protein